MTEPENTPETTPEASPEQVTAEDTAVATTQDTTEIQDAGVEHTTEIPRSAEQSEIEQLRAEVARLQAEMPPKQEKQDRTGWWRSVVVTFLVILIAILAPLSVVARWANNEVSDTSRYVESVSPLASDPAVQAAITNRITNEIMTRLEVSAITDQAVDALAERGLPPLAATSLKALATPLSNALEGFIHDEVAKLVESDEFQTAWDNANREAHSQMVAVLTGKKSDTIEVSGNTVSVNLATVIDTVKARLVDRGFQLAEKLPEVDAQFVIFQSADITKAQNAFRILNALNTWLPILALILLAIALGIARKRRTTLIAAMLAVAASMLLLGVALNAFRMVYLNAIPAEMDTAAAGAVYDTLVYFIRLALRAVLALSLVVALIAWLSGSSSTAGRVRGGTNKVIGSVRNSGERAGLDTGRFGAFLFVNKTIIRGTVLGLALLGYVMVDHPTGQTVFVLLIVVAVVLLIVELLARPPAEVEPSSTAPLPPTT